MLCIPVPSSCAARSLEQVSEEEHSDNYRRGVPSRREGLLSMIGGGAAEDASEGSEDGDGDDAM